MENMNDKLAYLLRDKLEGAEMEVRNDFWKMLQEDLPKEKSHALGWQQWAIAASVLLILGVASTTLWLNNTLRQPIQDIPQMADNIPQTPMLQNDSSFEQIISLNKEAIPQEYNYNRNNPTAHSGYLTTITDDKQEEEVRIHVSFTVTQHTTYNNYPTTQAQHHTMVASSFDEKREKATPSSYTPPTDMAENKRKRWALKAFVGSQWPKKEYELPFSTGITAEYALNEHLSLESGLIYKQMEAKKGRYEEFTKHCLQIPLKMNIQLNEGNKWELYAQAGMAAEKCIAGIPDNDFEADPIALSATAGIGIRYKLNEQLALFAEPSVTHYFDTDSAMRTIQTERSTNLALQCGIRMKL